MAEESPDAMALAAELLATVKQTEQTEAKERMASQRASKTSKVVEDAEVIGRLLASKEQALEQWDEALWAKELPNTRTEARFQGNLGLRLLKGITASKIEKMTIRDRVSAANICFTNRDSLLDRPTANINFSARQGIHEAMEALRQEGERRLRERTTIDVTPTDATHES